MNRLATSLAVILYLLIPSVPKTEVQDQPQINGPVEYTYRTVNGRSLKAFVFQPAAATSRRTALVLFHGGGWTMGEPQWAFGRAKYFAGRGIVAIAVQYRLSDQKSVTPLEAMEDARSAIQWVRSNASMLRVDASRVVAYGWSAGGHLAACTAIFPDTALSPKVSSVPNALILVSPALHLEKDGWVRRLLGSRAPVSSISPVSHIRKGLPPTVILQGSDDTVTPLEGARLFTDRMVAQGNSCVLHVFPKVGHMFTPVGTRDDEWPQPDARVQALAYQKADEFLISLGLMK